MEYVYYMTGLTLIDYNYKCYILGSYFKVPINNTIILHIEKNLLE